MIENTVIITGATSVLGSEIVKQFSGNGYNLILHFNKDDSVKEKLENHLKTHFPTDKRIWIKGSFEDADFILSFISTIKAKCCEISVLVNNAGITINKPLINLTDIELDAVLDVNLNATRKITGSVLRNMVKNKKGHIFHISSYQGACGGGFISAYSASKAAIIGFSKSIAKEYGKYNICSNIILPGYMDSAMTKKNSPIFREKIRNENCLKRINDPFEVAKFINFMSTLKNISGQVFNLDSRIIP